MTKWGGSGRAADQGADTVASLPVAGVTQMALRFKLQFVVDADDDQQVSVDELVVLDKDYERLEQLGLTLAEAESSVPTSERRGLVTGTATTTPAHAAFFRPDWDRPQAKIERCHLHRGSSGRGISVLAR